MTDPKVRAKEFERIWQEAIDDIGSGHEERGASTLQSLSSEYPDLFCEVASRLAQEGEEEVGLTCFQIALKYAKAANFRAMIWNHIGLILCNTGQVPEAIKCFETALKLTPNDPNCYSNLALSAYWQGRLDDSIRHCKSAQRLNPWHHDAQFTEALAVLNKGDYRKGFELYECRWRSRNNGIKKAECPVPEWRGEPNKTLFVYGEQGSGDSILMVRYARLIKELGCKQYWVFQKGLKPLIETMGVIDGILEIGEEIPNDVQRIIPAMSLARIFAKDIDAIHFRDGYIHRPLAIFDREKLHVGVCWRGSKVQLNDRFRSTNLGAWTEVLSVPGVQFHSLQVDGSEEGHLYPTIEPWETPKDWLETARRIASMDLVITIDTSIAHLCGAMGIPCWVALHCRPYFVYPLTRQDCPWYSSIRLYKQRREYEWHPVFQSIANDLRDLAGSVREDSLPRATIGVA